MAPSADRVRLHHAARRPRADARARPRPSALDEPTPVRGKKAQKAAEALGIDTVGGLLDTSRATGGRRRRSRP